MNKNTGFTETLILPKIQPKNILPNSNICPTVYDKITSEKQKTKKYFIPSQFPKLL